MAKHQRYFTVRLIHGAWYVHIFEQGRIQDRYGPFTHAEAEAKAAETGYLDQDKHLTKLEADEAREARNS